jgi:hypothetical protein
LKITSGAKDAYLLIFNRKDGFGWTALAPVAVAAGGMGLLLR